MGLHFLHQLFPLFTPMFVYPNFFQKNLFLNFKIWCKKIHVKKEKISAEIFRCERLLMTICVENMC